MSSSEKRTAQAGGVIVAGSMIAGVVGGTIVGQASIGFLVGTAAGLLMLLVHWLYDRRR